MRQPCLGGVRFFLLDVVHAILLAEIGKLFTKRAEANLCELLIRHLAEVDRTFEVAIVSADDCADIVLNAIVYDIASRLADVVLGTIVAFRRNPLYELRRLHALLVGNGLEVRLAFVPILVD